MGGRSTAKFVCEPEAPSADGHPPSTAEGHAPSSTAGPRPSSASGRSHTNAMQRLRAFDGSLLGVLEPALDLAHALETETDRALRVVGLSARGFLVLAEIHREPPRTQRVLARRLGLEPSTTNELLGRLARRRLVRRKPRPALTDEGLAALERAAGAVEALERRWAQRLCDASGSPRVPGWPGPVYGLRRWLRESRAALSAPPGARATPR